MRSACISVQTPFLFLGHVICSTIQNKLPTANLWEVHYGTKDTEILNLLSEGLKVTLTWTSACKSLTETYWPNYALHTWSGKLYTPPFCTNFQARLKEVNGVMVYKKLM